MEVLGSHRADNTNGADDYAKFRWSLRLGPNKVTAQTLNV